MIMKNPNKKPYHGHRQKNYNTSNKWYKTKAETTVSSNGAKSIDVSAIKFEIRHLKNTIARCERRIDELERKLLAAGVKLDTRFGVWAFPGAVMTPMDIMKHMGRNLLLSDTPNFMKYYKSTNHGKISFGTIKRGL